MPFFLHLLCPFFWCFHQNTLNGKCGLKPCDTCQYPCSNKMCITRENECDNKPAFYSHAWFTFPWLAKQVEDISIALLANTGNQLIKYGLVFLLPVESSFTQQSCLADVKHVKYHAVNSNHISDSVDVIENIIHPVKKTILCTGAFLFNNKYIATLTIVTPWAWAVQLQGNSFEEAQEVAKRPRWFRPLIFKKKVKRGSVVEFSPCDWEVVGSIPSHQRL